MLGDATITFTGNLTADPELRFTASGQAVANFSVAVTGRTKNAAGEWKDGNVTFFRCAAWRSLAEHIDESLHKGDRVTVTGTISSRPYEHQGEKRLSWDVECDDLGLSLRFAGARVLAPARAVA